MSLLSYIFTFTEGMLTFISPCILPMLPLYFVYLAGSAAENNICNESSLVENMNRKNRLILNSLAFVIGFTLVFVILGAAASAIGNLFTNYRVLLRQISGIVIILFGLNFLGILNFRFLNVEKRMTFNFKNLKFFSSLLFGIIFAAGWSPCLGAFLGAAIAKASNADSLWQGVVLLLLFSMGLGIPFILSAILFDKIKGTFKQIQKHSRIISTLSGILLIIMGNLIFFDILKYINF